MNNPHKEEAERITTDNAKIAFYRNVLEKMINNKIILAQVETYLEEIMECNTSNLKKFKKKSKKKKNLINQNLVKIINLKGLMDMIALILKNISNN